VPDINDAWRRYSQGDYQGAANLASKLLADMPNDASVICCNAVSNWQLGADAGKCVADMRRAAAIAPNDAWIWHNLGTVLASVGDLEEARASYSRAIDLKPDDTQAFYGLTQNLRFTEETELVRRMMAEYSSGRLSQRQQEYVCFALAKVYNDLGKHKRAVHFCIEGNWLAHRPYDPEPPRAALAELRRMVVADSFRGILGAEGQDAEPIFVVGMPRSGTTLVETILSRHPEVHAGGELQHIAHVERALLGWAQTNRGYAGGPYEMLKDIPREFFGRNAEAVLRRVTGMAKRPFSRFTDKLPENTQRLGLIRLLFPKARIIHMRRNALDCCVSILFLHFAQGNGFAFRQDLLGERYRQVAKTMRLWHQAVDLPILDVNYESLVSDPEPAIRRIIEFAGLPWDEACLSPQLSNRHIVTSNQWQVRQPINTASVGRWRNYEEWLQPLIASLGGLGWVEAEHREMTGLAA